MRRKKADHRSDKAAAETVIGGATPLHIAQTCVRAAESGQRLTLWLPAEPGRTSTQRIYKGGPLGDIVDRAGILVPKVQVAFDPMAVLAWLHHEGLINVVEKKGIES